MTAAAVLFRTRKKAGTAMTAAPCKPCPSSQETPMAMMPADTGNATPASLTLALKRKSLTTQSAKLTNSVAEITQAIQRSCNIPFIIVILSACKYE